MLGSSRQPSPRLTSRESQAVQGGLELMLGSSCSVSPGAGPGPPGFLSFLTLGSFLSKSMEVALLVTRSWALVWF